MNGSHHGVLGAEEFRAQDPTGHALYETCMAKVVPHLMTEFGSQLDDADRESIAAGAFVTAYRKGIDREWEPVAYVKKIAYRDALGYLKSLSRSVLVDPTDPTGLLSTFTGTLAKAADADTSDDVDADEAAGQRHKEDAGLWDLVDPAIGDIGAPQRREVIRRQSRGQHTQRIADELRIPPNQVYQQHSRGIADLRTALKPYIRPDGRPPAATEPGEQ